MSHAKTAAVASVVTAAVIIVIGLVTVSGVYVIGNSNNRQTITVQNQPQTIVATETLAQTILSTATENSNRMSVQVITYTTTVTVTTTRTENETITQSASFAPIILISVNLCGGVTASSTTSATSNFTFSVENVNPPNEITDVSLRESGMPTISSWNLWNSPFTTAGIQSDTTGTNSNFVPLGTPQGSVTLYPWSSPSEAIPAGQTYYYQISFADGQVLSGSVVAE
jgi:hypothetical protein